MKNTELPCLSPGAAMAGQASCHHIRPTPMEQRTSSTAVFVFLASIIYGEIKGSTQSVTQPCEKNKKAISLCESSSDNRPSGFLTYNMSTSPEWCNCSLSTDQEDTMDVQFSTTVHNATYDFVLHVARGGGGNISGRHGHWNDSISKKMPWTVYLSKANLKTKRAAIQGLCFSYEVKNETTRFSILCRASDTELDKSEPRNTSLIIWFLSGLACALAIAAVVVVFMFQKPRCVGRDRRFSTKAQDEILTALQRTSSRGEDKDGEKDGQEDGLEKTSGECRLPLQDHTAQGACISSSEAIHDRGVAKESSARGYLGTTHEPGNHIELNDVQTGPSAEGDVGASDDEAEKSKWSTILSMKQAVARLVHLLRVE
ncbi:uncharacterized protein LOC124289086 isoform X2 [Haliotis rubra]|uniref:uncharacterized protein LOC124289086 isoform X2 n=1 Tax=Haliotis rubra TaxID=36100 RepID=UPI001EE5FF61|nr:uncharacterized protein LOC124289086 isoform X2 [Haliotis rubra]